MSIARINTFKAKKGQGQALYELMESILPAIRNADGCESCQLLQGQEDPTRVVVYEIWDRIESHQAAIKSIPSDLMQRTMTLLDDPPEGEYYRL